MTGREELSVERPARPPRRLKAQFHLWLDPGTGAALRAAATARRVPATVLAEQFIRDGLGLIAAHEMERTALPAVEEVVRRLVQEQGRRSEDRIVKLLVKIWLELGVTRRMVFAHEGRTLGREMASKDQEAAFSAAAQALGQPGLPRPE